MRLRHSALLICAASVTAACSEPSQTQQSDETQVIDLEQSDQVTPAATPDGEQIGTPMEDRVATLGILNKRNNVSQDVQLSPGESTQTGDVEVTVQACERTAPWELRQETGAFVQVSVRGRGESEYGRIFSGWLFKESPSLNVVEHPIYDVWVKDCEMSFPGEE